MEKKIKLFLSGLFPKGKNKELFKLKYYNFITPNNIKFKINDLDNTYYTNYNYLEFVTAEPLYLIYPDFEYYQHLYKIKSEDIVMDAGANDGYLTLLFSKLIGKNGKVYAFEPDAINIKNIAKNIALDKSLLDNIKIEELLLWNSNEKIDFYEAGTVGSSAIWVPDANKTVKKQAVTIDSWVLENNIQKLDFIKMDIEGAEIKAIEGCLETIKTLKPNFAIASYHIVNDEPTYIKLEKFFTALNYPVKTLKLSKNEIITFAGNFEK